MAKLSIAEKLRVSHVKRWQIVRVLREQNIAEHMYKVYLLTKEICERLEVDASTAYLAMSWALMHDLPEVVTGDLATPLKRQIRKVAPNSDPLLEVELAIDDEYAEMHNIVTTSREPIYTIVKVADLLEAASFLQIEGVGSHASQVAHGLRRELNEQIQKLKPFCKKGEHYTAICDLRHEVLYKDN